MEPERKITALYSSSYSKSDNAFDFPFILVLCYLLLEYTRPQSIIPILGLFRLPAIVMGLLLFSLISSRLKIFKDFQTKLFIIFLILMAKNIPFATNTYWAFWTTYGMVVIFISYLAIANFVNSMKKIEWYINIWFFAHIILAVYSIKNHGRGIGGFFEDENDFSLALNMIMPYSFFLFHEAKQKTEKIKFLLMTGLFIVANLITFSRGGFIGLSAVFLYYLFKSPRKVLAISLIVLLIGIVVYLAPAGYWEEIKTIQQGTNDATGGQRIYLWKIAWKMFLDHSFIGVGPGNYNWNVMNYETGIEMRIHGGITAHSAYFVLLSELAIPGVIIILLMLYTSYKDRKSIIILYKNRERIIEDVNLTLEQKQYFYNSISKAYHLTLAITGSLIAYLVSGIFISVLYYPHFWLLLAFTLALKQSLYNELRARGVENVLL